jgi:putative adenylate-forming enzyme
VVSVAEVLEDVDRARIEKAFGGILHQVYQCTEGFLGITCALGHLHLNEDMIVVEREEIEGGQGRFVPIVTDFVRTSQPILRYRLNDILVPAREPCPCGSVFQRIERVEGRSDDLCWVAREGTNTLVPVFSDMIRRVFLLAGEGVREFEARQRGLDDFEFLVAADPARRVGVEAILRGEFCALMAQVGARTPRLEIQWVERELLTSARDVKRRRVRRMFELPASQGEVRP